MTEDQKKPSFLDVIKAAQANKNKIPHGKTKQIQQSKVKNQVNSNRPTKRSSGRGG